MNQKTLPALLASGNPGVYVTQITTSPLLSELDLIAAGVSKPTAKRTIQKAGGAAIGNRWFVTLERFQEYLDRESKALAPTPKAPKKAPTTVTMTAVQIAEAAGLRMVRK